MTSEKEYECINCGQIMVHTRAVPDVPELVKHTYDTLPASLCIDNVELALHSQAAEIIATKDEKISQLTDAGERLLSDLETAEAKNAQYEAQEPVAWMHPEAGWTDVCKVTVANHCKHGIEPLPLYASPAPAADMKAENIERELDGYIQHFREQTRIAPVHVTKALSELKIRLLSTLNVEASHDKG